MALDSNDPFIKQCEKAILFVTTQDNPDVVRVYFAPEDHDAARAAAPIDKEPEEEPIYDPLHKQEARYPYIFYAKQDDGFQELETLRAMAKEGKITGIESPGRLEDVWPEVEHFLKVRQVVTGATGKEEELALEHEDRLPEKDEIPGNVAGSVTDVFRLIEASQDKVKGN